ncbi:hypothetical protein [Methanobacterium spitsbergense]|uniref:Uncharacterized protein n=1 Tax=Methanobacterium spitsbergense TaxID=2874285 RepID=A0A8T5V210_9EURY|nr:hypothetical protein [Methanobacterium spitsbergense]MBZ2166989.1 hypothetical protein [Methanobacterium spitsbergense]
MKVKVGIFEKVYVCRKCGNPNIRIYTESIGGSSSCYECPECKRAACNPQKMLKLKNDVDPEDIIRMRNELIENSANGYTSYSPHLSRVIEMGNALVEGKSIIKDVTQLVYKNKVLISRNKKKIVSE